MRLIHIILIEPGAAKSVVREALSEFTTLI